MSTVRQQIWEDLKTYKTYIECCRAYTSKRRAYNRRMKSAIIVVTVLGAFGFFINEWIDSVQINCSFDHLLTSFISIIIDKNIKIEYFLDYNRYNTPFPRKYYRAISKQYDFWWQCGQANLLNFGV